MTPLARLREVLFNQRAAGDLSSVRFSIDDAIEILDAATRRPPATTMDLLIERHLDNMDAFLELMGERDKWMNLAKDLAKTLDGVAHPKLWKQCKEARLVE